MSSLPPATTRCPMCQPSPVSRSSLAGFFMLMTLGNIAYESGLCSDWCFCWSPPLPSSSPSPNQGRHRICWQAPSACGIKLFRWRHRPPVSQVIGMIMIMMTMMNIRTILNLWSSWLYFWLIQATSLPAVSKVKINKIINLTIMVMMKDRDVVLPNWNWSHEPDKWS